MNGLIKGLSMVPNRVEGKDWNGRDYKLLDDLIYMSKRGVIFTAPKGFISDLATWIRSSGRFVEASVMHDYLYTKKGSDEYGTNRRDADKLFKEMMTRGGCSRFRINMFYYGVRMFGWFFYKSK